MDCLSKEDRRLTKLAERIAKDLFTDGSNTGACRLVMAFREPGGDPTTTESEYQTGTGLCRKAVVDRILKHLRRSEAGRRRKKS